MLYMYILDFEYNANFVSSLFFAFIILNSFASLFHITIKYFYNMILRKLDTVWSKIDWYKQIWKEFKFMDKILYINICFSKILLILDSLFWLVLFWSRKRKGMEILKDKKKQFNKKALEKINWNLSNIM